MTDHPLKAHLFAAYNGFADKRIKDLAKSNKFIVDGRSDRDIASDGNLLSYFCMMFANVNSSDQVEVELMGNIPRGPSVSEWINKYRPTLREGRQEAMTFVIDLGQETTLDELAAAMRSIVRPGAPRYEVANYKYVCPRTADALERLAETLRAFGGVS